MTEPVRPKDEPLHPGGGGKGLEKLLAWLPALLALLALPFVRELLEDRVEREEAAGLGRLLVFGLVAAVPWLLKWQKERAASRTRPTDPRRPLEPS